MIFGILLALLGIGFYLATDMVSPTALIPSFFGAALIVLGLVATKDKLRMHAMHGAALLGLIGAVIPVYRVIKSLTGEGTINMVAVTEQVLMAILSGAFLVLCIKSFVDARRRRRQEGAG
jgi:uncharacterized membrane protein HdeD (DUF308 family)